MKINNITGIALQPFQKLSEEDLTKEELKSATTFTRALFIDLAATPAMEETIVHLESAGVEVAGYRDHHYSPGSQNPRDIQINEGAERIIARLGDRAVFVPRNLAPSCSRLVNLGEAVRHKIDLVLHHGDTDGFMGYLKLAGVGYDGMDDDADIFDSRGDETKLTEHGQLYRKATAALPTFDKNRPDVFAKAQEVLHQEFANYIMNDFSSQYAQPLQEKAKEAAMQLESANALFQAAEYRDGIAYVDTARIGKNKYNVQALTEMLEAQEGVKLTAQKKNSGPLSSADLAQITIVRHGRDQKTDLRDYLPEGAQSGVEHGRIFNTPFLLHLREDLFQDFVVRFAGGKTKLFMGGF